MNFFKIYSERYLFGELIIKDYSLYCISTYYNDSPFDYKNVSMIINNELLTEFKEEGYNEPEPCRVIIYSLLKKSLKYNVEVKYKTITNKYTIYPFITSSNTFTACTLFKDDYIHIESYYNYYKSQGVDKFYLYYNGNISKIYDKLFKANDIEYHEFNITYFDDKPINKYKGYYDINIKPNYKYHAQMMFLTICKIIYLPNTEYLLLNDLDEYIYNPKNTLLEKVKLNNAICITFPNKWSKIQEETKEKIILNVASISHSMIKHDKNECKKICNGFDRSKCVYSKYYKGFFGIHHPKKYKDYIKDNETVMYHIIDKGHSERTHLIVDPYTVIINKS